MDVLSKGNFYTPKLSKKGRLRFSSRRNFGMQMPEVRYKPCIRFQTQRNFGNLTLLNFENVSKNMLLQIIF